MNAFLYIFLPALAVALFITLVFVGVMLWCFSQGYHVSPPEDE